MIHAPYYSYQKIQEILSGVTLLDYGFFLASTERVRYTGRLGTHHYFEGKGIKMAIKGEVYFDFKKDKGGGLLSAVMDLEDLDFLGAVGFLESGFRLSLSELSTLKTHRVKKTLGTPEKSSLELLSFGSVQDPSLLNYFLSRGISSLVVRDYGIEVGLSLKGRRQVAFGLQNSKKGYELRTPSLKLKSGPSSYSIVEQSSKAIIVFEGIMDLLSYVELTYRGGSYVRRTLVVLNSVTTAKQFIKDFEGYEGTVFLCLDGDAPGTKATKEIQEGLVLATTRDVRYVYGLSETGFTDLNDALKSFLKL